MENKIISLESKIIKLKKSNSKLKKAAQLIPDNEYKRLIRKLEASEIELNIQNESLLEEVEELKKEINQLLQILTNSIEVA